MAIYTAVNPESFIDGSTKPANGRGAWVKRGIGFDYRYALAEDPAQRIGTQCEKSLDHWAVGIGCYAIQARLVELGHLSRVGEGEKGIFGPRTKAAVEAFQKASRDPAGGMRLDIDGTVGKSDTRALFTPLLEESENEYDIPDRLLVGETNHESALDPGAVGYFIYYPDYRGVDRGQSQINSRANEQVSWDQAFSPPFALDWSAKRLRSYYDRFKRDYPKTENTQLWCAAVCAHNNPSAAGKWAKDGGPPWKSAGDYVNSVLNARY